MATKYCPKCRQTYPSTVRSCEADQEMLSLRDPYHLVGNTLMDKYRIDALIGLGGMGAVYCAQHLGIDRRVAFKILQPNVALSNQHMVELFEQEAKLVGRLSHQNIVDVKDAGKTDSGIAYIVMEWLDGRTLDEELMAVGRLELHQTVEIARQIAAALDVAHHQHIIHRDLKPGNVMLVPQLGKEDLVKVLDFGIGKVIKETTAGTSVSSVVGTPNYASPEQLTEGAQIDRRTDIYSLGIIIYRMLGGRLPFSGSSMGELIQQQLYQVPPSLGDLRPEIPPLLGSLVDRMLEKNPDLRPQSAGELIGLLNRSLDDFGAAEPESDQEIDVYDTNELTLERKRPPDDLKTLTMSHRKIAAANKEQSDDPETRTVEATKQAASSRGRLKKILAPAFIGGLAIIGYGVYRNAERLEVSQQAAVQVSPTISPQLTVLPTASNDLVAMSPPPSPAAGPKSLPRTSPTPLEQQLPARQNNRAEAVGNSIESDRRLARARSLYKAGQYQEALVQCNEALRIDPRNVEARQLKRKINQFLKILNGR